VLEALAERLLPRIRSGELDEALKDLLWKVAVKAGEEPLSFRALAPLVEALVPALLFFRDEEKALGAVQLLVGKGDTPPRDTTRYCRHPGTLAFFLGLGLPYAESEASLKALYGLDRLQALRQAKDLEELLDLAVAEEEDEEKALENLLLLAERLGEEPFNIPSRRVPFSGRRELFSRAVALLRKRGVRLGRGWLLNGLAAGAGKEVLEEVLRDMPEDQTGPEVEECWRAVAPFYGSIPEELMDTLVWLSWRTGCVGERVALRHHLLRYLERGGNPDALVDGDAPLLHDLIASRAGPQVFLLLGFGADLERCDQKGNTPLHRAAEHFPELFPYLLERGANPSVRNGRGRTPLEVLREGASKAMWERLSKHPLVAQALSLEALAGI